MTGNLCLQGKGGLLRSLTGKYQKKMSVYKGYKLFNEGGCTCKRKSPGKLSILEVEENTFRSGCVRSQKYQEGIPDK